MMSYSSIFASGIFRNRTIVITGGGSGIGRCVAHELASLGASVVLVGRTLSKLEKVATEIQADGGGAFVKRLDIRDEQAVVKAVESAIEAHGPIHGLVNNAGGQFPAKLEDISGNGFESVVRNNLTGGFLVAREVFRQSMKAHGGSIVNMSAYCDNGFPSMAHTGAARAGMENLTKSAAWEWARYSVRVNAVAPGLTATSGMDTYDAETRKMFQQACKHIPLKRMATESEVSAAVVFLLSPAAAFITGEIIHIDGASRFSSPSLHAPQPDGPVSNGDVFNGFHLSKPPLEGEA